MNNPFEGTEVIPAPQHDTGALVEVEQQRAIAETQAAMIIAKRFPRDQKKAVDRILTACTRVGLAESALYQYARGGTDITGPSIRLAEAIAQNWGNLQFGIRELEQAQGSSTVEAFAWDIESNVRQTKTFQVTHKRYTRKATYSLEDPRDIYEMVANQGARRLRACILGLIPGDVIEAAVSQCEGTLKTKGNVTPERIRSLLEKFSEMGISRNQIESRIQRHADAITPALMVSLGKIYNSIKDGMSNPLDWFEPEEGKEAVEKKPATESLKDKLREQRAESEPEPPTEPGESGKEESESLYQRIIKARPGASEKARLEFLALYEDEAALRAMTDEERKAAREKYHKVVGENALWPLNEPKTTEPELETDAPDLEQFRSICEGYEDLLGYEEAHSVIEGKAWASVDPKDRSKIMDMLQALADER